MKILKKILLLLFIMLFISGCIEQVSKKDFVLSISEYQLSNSFKKSFPLKKILYLAI
jgi:PBP1b-binding outer membrane lipoprotein LpoB